LSDQFRLRASASSHNAKNQDLMRHSIGRRGGSEGLFAEITDHPGRVQCFGRRNIASMNETGSQPVLWPFGHKTG
jgi:hypothetical protein